MKIETAAQQFLQYLTLERGCSDATADAYDSDVRRCIAYLDEQGIEPVTQNVTPVVLRQYVTWLAGQGCSGATIRRRVSGLSSLWKWLIYSGHATENPCASVLLPKKHRRMPAVLTLDEARRMLVCSEGHPNPCTAFRNRAIISTLLYCGLRRSELVGLEADPLREWFVVHAVALSDAAWRPAQFHRAGADGVRKVVFAAVEPLRG